jgi:AcrR family transcriptional regulator
MTNKTSRKKARLVKTVFKMLSEGGDSKLTSREIARRARVSLPAINYYFGSKSNLIRQAEQVYIDEVRKSTGMVIPPGKDPRKALFEHCIKSTAFSSANPGVQRRLFINFLCDKDITPEIIEMNKENAIQVKKMIGKLVKDRDKIVSIKSAIFGAALVNFQILKETKSYAGAIDLRDPKLEKEFYRVLIDCLAHPYSKP